MIDMFLVPPFSNANTGLSFGHFAGHRIQANVRYFELDDFQNELDHFQNELDNFQE